MTVATSASDRYETARAALTEYDTVTAARVQAHPRRLAEALRDLITPPATEEMPDLADVYSRAHRAALPNETGPYTVADLDHANDVARRALYLSGIQAAWESWEPDVTPAGDMEARASVAEKSAEYAAELYENLHGFDFENPSAFDGDSLLIAAQWAARKALGLESYEGAEDGES